jgi:hypothetical protein
MYIYADSRIIAYLLRVYLSDNVDRTRDKGPLSDCNVFTLTVCHLYRIYSRFATFMSYCMRISGCSSHKNPSPTHNLHVSKLVRLAS